MLAWSENIPLVGKYDVIVAGGGLSGAAAALAAARMGKKVLLLEKATVLGGLATMGLINFWVPLCNGRGKQVIRGMAEEFLRLSIRHGFDTLPPEWRDGQPEQPTDVRYVTHFSIGIFALELVKLLTDAGVTILYDALVSMPVMAGRHCRGLIIDGKSGRKFYEGKVIVDATGDCDIFHRAGAPTADGRNFFTMIAQGTDLEHCRRALEKGNIHYAYTSPTGGPASLHGHGHPEGMPVFMGASMETVNEYLLKNQLLLYEKIKDQPRLERDIHYLPGMAQLRTSRRIQGVRPLTEEDLYRHQDTSVGAICDFDRRDSLYEVPYGALVCEGYDNLITCGRSASALGWAWDVLRVIPPAVLTGQAAGIAAAQTAESGGDISALPIAPLQRELEKSGVLIHFDDAWIPRKRGWEDAPLAGHF